MASKLSIRWTKNQRQTLRREVLNYNRRLAAAEKRLGPELSKLLPEKASYTQLKAKIKTGKQLTREMNKLRAANAKTLVPTKSGRGTVYTQTRHVPTREWAINTRRIQAETEQVEVPEEILRKAKKNYKPKPHTESSSSPTETNPLDDGTEKQGGSFDVGIDYSTPSNPADTGLEKLVEDLGPENGAGKFPTELDWLKRQIGLIKGDERNYEKLDSYIVNDHGRIQQWKENYLGVIQQNMDIALQMGNIDAYDRLNTLYVKIATMPNITFVIGNLVNPAEVAIGQLLVYFSTEPDLGYDDSLGRIDRLIEVWDSYINA